MKVGIISDRIELICRNCKSVQIFIQRTEEDLKVLLEKKNSS